jgi:Lysyl oxidase
MGGHETGATEGILGWSVAGAAVAVCALILAVGCGGGGNSDLDEPGPPVGRPVLPDLVPSPPRRVHLRRMNGRWSLSFDSILVNVGDGEFLLRAKRDGNGKWQVEQDIPYSTSGAKPVPLRPSLVWGGDGHEHWHVPRVATNELVRLDKKGRPVRGESWTDAKVGFCFFDFSRQLATKGPEEAVHSRHSCGHEDDDVVGMGLSPGWGDTYPWVLPGQSIDITDLPDGTYRLQAEADQRRWFREVTRKNNRTWAEFELSTRDGLRYALVTKVGPAPRDA